MTNTYPQYGIYLIPPPHLLSSIGQAHQLLATEFNARLAGRFMVHCTVKGFFKLKDGASPADFIPALDEMFITTPAFPTEIIELWKLNRGSNGASILLGMERTEIFHKLHNDVWELVQPYIAPDCLFSPSEPAGPNFMPHITLGQSDVPTEPGLFEQAAALCQHILDSSLKGQFLARSMQLIEFYSEDWAGNWGNTLNYKQLKGWQLTED